jgi:hypothetical protein
MKTLPFHRMNAMKYLNIFLTLSILFLFGCNEDETNGDDPPMETTTANDYGSYLYNGVEKNLVDGFFRISESGELVLNLVDQNERLLRLFLYGFEGNGVFENPAPMPQFSGSQFYLFDGSTETFWLRNDSTSSVLVLSSSGDLISGSFDLRFTGQNSLIGANWTEGQFYDVPAYELQTASVGAQYLRGGVLTTIDSIHTRITNTFFGEIYVYGTTFHGLSTRSVFRFEIFVEDNGLPYPRVWYGGEPYQLSLYDSDVENSFDGNGITTGEIKGEHNGISIRFDNQPIDEYPKPYGADGELVLYRPDETFAFDEVNVILDFGADTVLVATNQSGNKLIAKRPPWTSYQGGLNTNGERPGVDIEFFFYSLDGNVEPEWTSRGYMHYDYNDDGSINLGYETYYLAPDDIIPTYLRMKNHIL